MSGEREIRFFKAPTKYKKIAEKYVAENIGSIYDSTKRVRKERAYYERGLSKLLNLQKSLGSVRRDILKKLQNIIPAMKNLSVDEIAGVTSSMRAGSGPYAIFGQVIDKDFNTAKGSLIDAKKGTLEKRLINLSKDDPERLRLQKNYNERVNEFELKANKNNPIKKVKGLKLSFKPPSETVKNNKVYNQYKDLFDAHYNKYGYSFEVPADRDSIVDISKKLDNKAFQNTVKNRFTKLIGKGGKYGALVGAGTLAGTGWALADRPTGAGAGEVQSKLPGYGDAAITGTGAAIASKFTKRDPLKKVRRIPKQIASKIFRGAGTPLAGPLFAATNVASKMGEGQSFVDAVIDPITGLELSFPGLFKENVSKITKNPWVRKALTLGRFGRMLTPIGLGVAAVGQAQEFYNQYQALQKLKREDPEAYERFRKTRVGPALTEEDYTDIYSNVQGAANGGLMSLTRTTPPTRGPQHMGLDYLKYYGR